MSDTAAVNSTVLEPVPRKSRRPRWLPEALAIGYPVALVASLYVSWLVAWAALGYRPRPMLDDPKFIGFAVDVACTVAMILLMCAPGALAIGGIAAIHSAWRRGPTTAAFVARSAAVLALLAITWVASFAFLRWDPIDVVTWYMD